MRPVLSLLLFVLLATGLPFGCLNCKCPDLQGNYFRATDIILTNGVIVNDCCLFPATPGDSIVWQEYRGFVDFATEFYGMNESAPNGPDWQLPLGINPAMACECTSNGWMGMQESIADMEITTVFDYNAQHAAGELLNDMVLVRIDGDTLLLANYLNQPRQPVRNQGFEWWLARAPQGPGIFATELRLELSNGREFKKTYSTVRLK